MKYEFHCKGFEKMPKKTQAALIEMVKCLAASLERSPQAMSASSAGLARPRSVEQPEAGQLGALARRKANPCRVCNGKGYYVVANSDGGTADINCVKCSGTGAAPRGQRAGRANGELSDRTPKTNNDRAAT